MHIFLNYRQLPGLWACEADAYRKGLGPEINFQWLKSVAPFTLYQFTPNFQFQALNIKQADIKTASPDFKVNQAVHLLWLK